MDGIIIINKEKDYTSNDVVQIIKKTCKEKVGHTGTLDPMATGVLPILIGKGTLLSKYLINHDKVYTATVKLGIKTNTGDITGETIETKIIDKNTLQEKNVKDALKKIEGTQQQVPPMYSAIKINGKKLYEYARKGQEVEIKPREIQIFSTKLLQIINQTNEIKFKVSCSKGTYIRTLCEALAEKLGTIGTMSELNREQVGDFNIDNAISLEEYKEKYKNKNFMESNIITIENFFAKNGKILLSQRSFIAFINGVKLLADEEDGVYRIYNIDNKFIGIGIIKNGILKRDIVI